jgi:hypothetical protein
MTADRATRAIEEGKYCVLVVPLGELPPEEALKGFVEEVRERERNLWPWSHNPKIYALEVDPKDPADVLRALLERVRGREGIRFRQLTGEPRSHKDIVVSALTVVGVHGLRSAYIAHYGRARVGRTGRFPYGPFEVLEFLSSEEGINEQFDFLEEMLLRRYPPLREFPVTVFVEAVEVGQVVFPIGRTGHAPCVIIGKTLLPLLNPGHQNGPLWPLPWERIARADEEALVRVLRKRTLLGLLPAKTARNLLRGKGDPKEVDRVAAMARLSGL